MRLTQDLSYGGWSSKMKRDVANRFVFMLQIFLLRCLSRARCGGAIVIPQVGKEVMQKYLDPISMIGSKRPTWDDSLTILSFTSCDCIRSQQNIIFVGSTGLGKSYLSSTLVHQACRQGIKARFYSMVKLIEDLRVEQAKSKYNNFMKSLSNIELLF